MARKRNSDVVATPWFVRLGLYALVAVAGLVGVWRGWVDQATVDSWLGQTGSLAALVGGLFAALNVNRDEKVDGNDRDTQTPPRSEPEPAPAPRPTSPAPSVGNATLDQLRDIIATNRQG